MQYLSLLLLCGVAAARVITYAGIPNNETVYEHNTAVLNATLASLQPGDVLVIPNNTYHVNGGIEATGLKDVVFRLDGTLSFNNNQKTWPRQPNSKNVKECMYFQDLTNVTFTSSGTGTLQGNGAAWWGYVSYLLIGENRPRLFHISQSSELLVENIHFLQSPYWTTFFSDVRDVEIRYCEIDAQRDDKIAHDIDNLGAFNTDGFDVAGANIHVHHVKVVNQDDCLCVKEQNGDSKMSNCSENILFEDSYASGLGLTIGSIGASAANTCVRNITFRNIFMEETFKGIYIKSRPSHGIAEITDVVYDNITMVKPGQWGIWIGPQQAVYGGACSLFWPYLGKFSTCPVPAAVSMSNFLLRDVTVTSPKLSPGVILGNSSNPIRNITFENVVVTDAGKHPFDSYKCEGVVDGFATGTTSPVPSCFTKK